MSPRELRAPDAWHPCGAPVWALSPGAYLVRYETTWGLDVGPSGLDLTDGQARRLAEDCGLMASGEEAA